jgi:uncharacterized protein (TIGR02271 family)
MEKTKMAHNNENDNTNNTANTNTEPATGHDVGIGGGLGVVGGAVVGALAGGPVGAVIGAIAGGVVSAGAVDVVDKHDHDYNRTAHGANATDTTDAAYNTAPAYNTGTAGYADTAINPIDGYTDTRGTTGYAVDPDADLVTDEADTNYAGNRADYNSPSNSRNDSLQLREEELQASKQSVQAGEVTLRKDVITENRSIDVPVTHEELVVERRPVTNAQAVAGDLNSDSEVIRVPLTEEQVTLQKNTVVTGEVSVAKREVTETEHLSGTVRREEARIDATDGAVVVDRDKGSY